MRKPKCCRCEALATFDAPRRFCDEHWARWWGGYDPKYPYEPGDKPSLTMYREALASAKAATKREILKARTAACRKTAKPKGRTKVKGG